MDLILLTIDRVVIPGVLAIELGGKAVEMTRD